MKLYCDWHNRIALLLFTFDTNVAWILCLNVFTL